MKVKPSIVSLLAMLLFPALAGADSFAPPSGKTLLFVGQDRDTLARYVRGTGSVPGGTMFYTSVQDLRGLQKAANYGSGPQDAKALLRYRHSTIQIGLYMVGALGGVVTGKYDKNLKILAQWIKKARRPVYLRIGYEFDNPENHYDPQLYQQAFRYVVDFLRGQGVSNAAYVWHSYCPEEAQWMDWYPGNDYVDWFGASIFASSQIWRATDFLELARKHRKPFMIAESTPAGMYSVRGKLDWFKHVFRFIRDRNVEAFCYIDSNWDAMPMFVSLKWGDARIEQKRELKDFWLKEIRDDRYLKSSPDLFKNLGWTK